MARPSYGPEAKKRSLHLFTVLLDYANDELDCDEVALDALRSQMQTYWQSEQRLVVRTKVRFLEALTKLANTPLSGGQIKEALRRFEDFLAILDDNRPNKGGSEVWHFTLNLWHKRSDRAANLRQFEQAWEHRRPQKSKQVTGEAPIESEDSGVDGQDFWWQLCRESLEAQQYGQLTLNPLTVADGIAFDVQQLYLPLGLVERKRRESRHDSSSADPQLDEAEDAESPLSLEAFFERLQAAGQQRVAIVGEPGAGKTTLLQKIATWLLEQQSLPIWVSLADLQGATLEHYLLHDWLKQATRKLSVAPELQEAFAEQFQQGRVWLLLDAIDEMALDAATALTSLSRQLRGWLADAHVVLTCRSNVWDGGKNALAAFTTYGNLSFSIGNGGREDQVGQFIDRWFQDNPSLGDRLRQALDDPKRKRISATVKNPLRLALLCRTWSLTQGTLPQTKALLYQQFVETIYDWKQDRFPTTLTQRQQLNEALGQVALQALLQPETRFRLSHTFAQTAFAQSLELMSLALQLGWLNQVGLSTNTGEKVYAFYHPTFQEYFAAQSLADWHFFFDPAHAYPVFNPHWREVILLWFGRMDIAIADKEAFIQALITFDDRCGGFYSHRAYFLAAAGLAEFPQSIHAQSILSQLLQWRFGVFPPSVCEGARVALLQTDRTLAIAALEQFIQITENPFARWQSAYTLGKTLDPGNPLAIAALTQLSDTLQNETLRLQVLESLGKIAPDHSVFIQSLEQLLASTQQGNVRRRAAYSLGKMNAGHPKAIATLEQIIQSTTNATLRLRTAENLLTLDPAHALAMAVLASMQKPLAKTSRKRLKAAPSQDLDHLITTLEHRLATATDAAHQRRLAYRLATLQPGHPQAIDGLLQLLLAKETPTLYKRVVEDLKAVVLEPQLAKLVSQLSVLVVEANASTAHQVATQRHECHKLLWYCAQQMSYTAFSHAWCY
ncbi:HEAT repeat domain-containing protein [Stenomitos frigidus]|uniref:AAA family ATPase n=1 Tax=Stenomitos frigidus ULC18 TaxID=2107698 RepID=A0A2T1ELS8_9CYAN|nr:HEAT repeat domain-containing protein [Stenomitos frigidus]PSB33686.1 AAA family ATPase [Stenomitos frigidus ULC18]